MQSNSFFKAGLLALTLVLLFFISWETYWRSKGFTTTFDDGEPLWADKRAQVYKDPNLATVFIGSSRIKFDLDIPTWERITNDKAVQLAIEGNSPLPILRDLAADENFKGKLVIDVTEGLFFSNSKHDLETPQKHVDYYKKRTPTQRFSFEINHLLESQFAFLNKDYLSINGLFYGSDLPKRPNVFAFPYFPPEFSHVTFERQTIIEPKFLTDTSLQNMVTGNWLFFASLRKDAPPMKADELTEILNRVKEDVDLIKKRGGQVVFIRTPSSGPFLQMERMAFSRDKFWERLLQHTNTAGIHFEDYSATRNFICPEWSHLSQPDAVIYTKHLIRALEEKGWKFPHQTRLIASTSIHP